MERLKNGVEMHSTIVYAMATLIRQKMKNDVCGFVDQNELSKPIFPICTTSESYIQILYFDY